MNIKTVVLLLLFTVVLHAKVTLDITTSRAALAIDILDNVSKYNKHCPEFHKYWKKRYRISFRDTDKFLEYREVREKYFAHPEVNSDIRTNQNGIFVSSMANDADPILNIFFKSATVNEALNNLKGIVEAEDIELLRTIFDLYKEQLDALISDFESYAPKSIAAFQSQFDEINNLETFFSEIQNFYGLNGNIHFTVLINWWPHVRRGKSGGACVAGNALVIRINDSRHTLNEETLISIILHELVHAIEMRIPPDRKHALSKVFIDEVNKQDSTYVEIPAKIIYEPMAVAIGQMLFMKRFFTKEFKLENDDWYANKWINCFAQPLLSRVESYFDEERTIDTDFMEELATLYVAFRRKHFR